MKTATTLLHRNRLLALAHNKAGRTWAKSYANLTQAQAAAETMGAGWDVFGFHPYYVGRPVASLVACEGPANDC